MKVILFKDIDKLGQKNDLKNVSDGYALNYLFPLKLAQPASAANLKNINDQAQKILAHKDKLDNQWEKISKILAGKKLVIKKSASVKGKLFAAVSIDDISAAIKKTVGIIIDKTQISLAGDHIKEIGIHPATLIIPHHKINLTIQVEAE